MEWSIGVERKYFGSGDHLAVTSLYGRCTKKAKRYGRHARSESASSGGECGINFSWSLQAIVAGFPTEPARTRKTERDQGLDTVLEREIHEEASPGWDRRSSSVTCHGA